MAIRQSVATLTPLIGAQQDVQRLRGDLDEARRRPPTEEQMRAMPQWRHMLEIGERGKQYMQANERLRADMRAFQARTGVDKVIVLWSANTERFSDVRAGLNLTADELLASIRRDDAEVAQIGRAHV